LNQKTLCPDIFLTALHDLQDNYGSPYDQQIFADSYKPRCILLHYIIPRRTLAIDGFQSGLLHSRT